VQDVAGERSSSNASSSSTTISSSTNASGSLAPTAQQQHHGLLQYPPKLTLGQSPSSSNTNLAGSPPGLGHTSIQQQQQQRPQQLPGQASLSRFAAAACAPGIVPDGWERPFVIGVAGGTGKGASKHKSAAVKYVGGGFPYLVGHVLRLNGPRVTWQRMKQSSGQWGSHWGSGCIRISIECPSHGSS
jgi:hypothetical protein